MKTWHRATCGALTLILTSTFGAIAQAQAPKELRTKQGAAVAIVNLVSPRKDCSANPGAVALPSIRQQPKGGTVQLQVVVTDVAAAGDCPARKVPAIALIYVPRKDFTGADLIQIEIDTDNRATLLSYRVTVSVAGEPL